MEHIDFTPQCECCGSTINVTFSPDPYEQEINGDDTDVWECEACLRRNAEDI